MYREYKHKQILDIISVGAVSTDERIVDYYPDLRILYIKLNDGYIMFLSIEQYSKMQVKFVDKLEYEYEIEESMSYARSSILDIVLIGRDMEGNRINNILYYEKEENVNNSDAIYCKACEIVLENGQIIFLDPGFLCGISIGGVEKKKYYLSCNSNNY